MRVKTIVDEDFTNYKKPAMFIGTISCGGKCCIEAGIPLSVCQNDGWRFNAPIYIGERGLCERYLRNHVTSAIVFGGLEPFEQWNEVVFFIRVLRCNYKCNDDIVIYTGYTPEEVTDKVEMLNGIENIIIKYGRYVPDAPSRYDDVLGVTLASDNQYAERIS